MTKQGPTYAQAARQKMARIDAQLELLIIGKNEELREASRLSPPLRTVPSHGARWSGAP